MGRGPAATAIMPAPPDETEDLLTRWHGGDTAARDALIERNLPWIVERVRARLGAFLRGRADSGDFVQEALLDFLAYTPRFQVASEAQFRALLLRVIEHAIGDQYDYHQAWRRRASREQPLPSDTVIDLTGRAPTPPDERAERNEEQALLRLALELLDPPSRRLIQLRAWDNLPFHEIAARLSTSEPAARKQHQRALQRLAQLLDRLRRGELP